MKGKGKQETYWLLGDTEKNEVFIHIFIPKIYIKYRKHGSSSFSHTFDCVCQHLFLGCPKSW